MELACILIITLGVNILHARFISYFFINQKFDYYEFLIHSS